MSKNKKEKLPEYKIITLGDSTVGKSSLILKFIDNTFSYDYLATMGIDYKHKIIELKNGKQVNLRIFDTAGQERFKSISLNFIKNANGILLLYDITKKQTFNSINKWIQSIKEDANEKVSIVLVGNKCDLEEKREVETKQGEDKAKLYEIPFLETSCKDGTNINEVFEILTEEILKRKGNHNTETGKQLTTELSKQKSKNCC